MAYGFYRAMQVLMQPPTVSILHTSVPIATAVMGLYLCLAYVEELVRRYARQLTEIPAPTPQLQRNRRFNEQIKMIVSLLNSISCAVIVGIVISPIMLAQHAPSWTAIGAGFVVAMMIHGIGHVLLFTMRAEE